MMQRIIFYFHAAWVYCLHYRRNLFLSVNPLRAPLLSGSKRAFSDVPRFNSLSVSIVSY